MQLTATIRGTTYRFASVKEVAHGQRPSSS